MIEIVWESAIERERMRFGEICGNGEESSSV